MSFKRLVLRNQRGASLPLVIAIITVGVASLSYVITDVLPKLQSEKKKAEIIINYRVFMSSINDYIIHGIRERWCLNVMNGIETDLLLSNNCSSEKQMEEVVTYPGNLERILWTADNIGAIPASPEAAKTDNRILGINYHRIQNKKTQVSLKYSDIYPPQGKMKFRLTRALIQDMSDQHPLYVMTKNVRECIDSVDIELFQVKDTNLIQSGDERKIGISIQSNISYTKLNCYGVRNARSVSYYTFYPRRLHTFALMKYKDLDLKLNNQFHGPVYVAGDAILPPEDFDKDNSSVFYSTLTLGVFNEGKGSIGEYRAGKVLTHGKELFTFADRGHPYLSKQDHYQGFRGFLGGIHLDSSEDKGFFNLFNSENTNSGNVSLLEQCIEEARAQTTPSANANSILAYSEYVNNGDNGSLLLSFTEKNRFKPGSTPVAYSSEADYGTSRRRRGSFWSKSYSKPLIFSIPEAPNGTRALGEISVSVGSNLFQGSIGTSLNGNPGSVAEVELNLETYQLTKNVLDDYIDNFKSVNKDNYRNIIEDSGHVLADMSERITFDQKAYDFFRRCNKVDDSCEHKEEMSAFVAARDAFHSKLVSIRSDVTSEVEPKMTFSLADLPRMNNLIIVNQKFLTFNFSSTWKNLYPYVKKKFDTIYVTFEPFHYSSKDLKLQLEVSGAAGNELRFNTQDRPRLFYTPPPEDPILYEVSWRSAFNNSLVTPAPKPFTDIDCPEGMGLADWDLDMSGSSAFAWNYANTPPGASINNPDHSELEEIVFTEENLEGHSPSLSKSVVNLCIVPPERTHVYGFYVCDKLKIIERTEPLYMIGTFIVNELEQPQMKAPIHWHSIWDASSADLIMNDLNSTNTACGLTTGSLLSKTFKDIISVPGLEKKLITCSAQDLVDNGPNNFSWTTVDPDIGLATPTDSMTSQKANRIQKWVIREESRVDFIR
jgi:hypothetical protein